MRVSHRQSRVSNHRNRQSSYLQACKCGQSSASIFSLLAGSTRRRSHIGDAVAVCRARPGSTAASPRAMRAALLNARVLKRRAMHCTTDCEACNGEYCFEGRKIGMRERGELASSTQRAIIESACPSKEKRQYRYKRLARQWPKYGNTMHRRVCAASCGRVVTMSATA